MKVKEVRALTGLSQRKFGEKYNIPTRSIEQWETEQRNPPGYVVELLEKVVKTDIKEEMEMKKTGTFVVVDDAGTDVFNEFFDTKEEANYNAKLAWERLTYSEKKKRHIVAGYIRREDLEDFAFEDDSINWNAYNAYDTDESFFDSDRL